MYGSAAECLASISKALGGIFTQNQLYSWGKLTSNYTGFCFSPMQLAKIQELVTCYVGAYDKLLSMLLAEV